MPLSLDPASLHDEDAIESEIQQLQGQLRRVRKQRELLELRAALAEEQRLLEDVKYRLEASASHTPTAEYQPPPRDLVSLDDVEDHVSEVSSQDIEDVSVSERVANWAQGDESELSDDQDYTPSTTSSVGSEFSLSDGLSVYSDASESDAPGSSWNSSSSFTPPPLSFEGVFEITTRGAFRHFKRRLADHFSKYSKEFRHDKWKVYEVERHLSRELLDEWLAAEREKTWCELHDFLLQKLPRRRGKRNGNICAMYWAASQREDQPVYNYNSYLMDLEVEMPQLLDEDLLVIKLLGGVLREVRHEWLGGKVDHPIKLDCLVGDLAAAERRLPGRVEKLAGKIPPHKKPRI
ncbi:hypothetical protein BJX96DRAFT_171325 [Aspergillus floccosus]